MNDPMRLTARVLARAMLTGEPSIEACTARMRRCFASEAAWIGRVADRLLPSMLQTVPTLRQLAEQIERDPDYQTAWRATPRPVVRHYIVEEAASMRPLPLGLNGCGVPHWPHGTALAGWLDLPPGGLWRLTRPSGWQRRAPLGHQHYHYRLCAKRTGGWRLLEVPEPHLRGLQRRLLDDLLDRIPPHEAACGYTRERSVLRHARAHAGQAVVLKFDLQDFFSCVRASQVHALFATLGYPEEVARALTAMCTTATPEPVLRRMHESGQLSWPQLQRLRDAHLPQGAPTSSALANLCAFRLDLRLEGLAHTLGARYTRYADDLVLSGDASLRAVRGRVETAVAVIARDEGFALNFRKTRCLPAGRRQTICSIVVNDRLNVPRDAFDRLKAVLHRCATHGPAAENRDGHPQWREHLRGRIAWVRQLNPSKAARLQRLFDRIDWSC